MELISNTKINIGFVVHFDANAVSIKAVSVTSMTSIEMRKGRFISFGG